MRNFHGNRTKLMKERKKMAHKEIQVHERLPFLQSLPLSIQHLFAMFGSTVLVPVLFGVDPATILLINGVGPLIYIYMATGNIPVNFGSSCAFLSSVFVGLSHFSGGDGYVYALGGFLMVAIVLIVIAGTVKVAETEWIDVLSPPAAMVVIVAVIGLER